jgi:ubiquinone/menaquinone biosynthesis C-methylase UbiE
MGEHERVSVERGSDARASDARASDQHALVGKQFGSTAAAYLASSVHAAGADLERLSRLAQELRPARVLDLGSGAGHVSYALARGGAVEVVAYDLAPEMLAVVAAEARQRGHANILIEAGPAERLPFADASFDWVVSRYSAHHWLDLPRALAEAARVCKSDGRCIVIDVVAPESALFDTVLQTIEILRDPSHVRDHRVSEWRRLLAEAGFLVTESHAWKLPMGFASWVGRMAAPAERVAALNTVFAGLPEEARRYFSVAADHSFSIDSAWIECVKRA